MRWICLVLTTLLLAAKPAFSIRRIAGNSTNTTADNVSLRAFLTPMLPSLRDSLPAILDGLIPMSYGNCKGDVRPPQPCIGSTDLYTSTGVFYRIRARWIAGLNVIHFDTFDVKFDRNGSMLLTVSARFDALPMSVQVDACLGYFCTGVLNNTDTCCGTNKTLTVVARIGCCTTPPFLCKPSVVSADVTPFVSAVVNVFGAKIDVWDLTPTFTSVLRDQVESVVLAHTIDLINELLVDNLGDEIVCALE
ncbi:hypothetical protein LEN26_015114 [Aphanomyces euteiches]|nr:hypothetical protein LEN26_015114 [Aphanomyces euteiches]KAH9106667.1 hypothetical protein AeMF1_017807 [Aphanomyces euteiches]KAH9183501.1 hypothetical protein AeNC1_014520 [Aphanomyces euteiches]